MSDPDYARDALYEALSNASKHVLTLSGDYATKRRELRRLEVDLERLVKKSDALVDAIDDAEGTVHIQERLETAADMRKRADEEIYPPVMSRY